MVVLPPYYFIHILIMHLKFNVSRVAFLGDDKIGRCKKCYRLYTCLAVERSIGLLVHHNSSHSEPKFVYIYSVPKHFQNIFLFHLKKKYS